MAQVHQNTASVILILVWLCWISAFLDQSHWEGVTVSLEWTPPETRLTQLLGCTQVTLPALNQEKKQEPLPNSTHLKNQFWPRAISKRNRDIQHQKELVVGEPAEDEWPFLYSHHSYIYRKRSGIQRCQDFNLDEPERMYNNPLDLTFLSQKYIHVTYPRGAQAYKDARTSTWKNQRGYTTIIMFNTSIALFTFTYDQQRFPNFKNPL